MLDLIVRNVEVFDGSGAKPYISCLGIVAGKIVAISQDIQDSSQTVLDGTGLSLCPGFIDVHSHSDILIANEKPPCPDYHRVLLQKSLDSVVFPYTPSLRQGLTKLKKS